MRVNPRVLFVLLIVLVSSCQKVLETATADSQIAYNEYYPSKLGFWVDYQVDSTRYIKSSLDPQPIITGTTIYIRELIEDTLIGFDTPYQFKVKVFTRKTLSEPWVFSKNISIQPLSNRITKNVDNIRLIKLHSPINAALLWKGNKHIDTTVNKLYGDWDYKYIDLFQTKTISSIKFDSTVTVLQHLDTNAIEKTHFYEVYAKNIGLIYAEKNKLEKQNADNGWDKPENGYTIVVKVIDWKR
jgi:hypothetical protein